MCIIFYFTVSCIPMENRKIVPTLEEITLAEELCQQSLSMKGYSRWIWEKMAKMPLGVTAWLVQAKNYDLGRITRAHCWSDHLAFEALLGSRLDILQWLQDNAFFDVMTDRVTNHTCYYQFGSIAHHALDNVNWEVLDWFLKISGVTPGQWMMRQYPETVSSYNNACESPSYEIMLFMERYFDCLTEEEKVYIFERNAYKKIVNWYPTTYEVTPLSRNLLERSIFCVAQVKKHVLFDKLMAHLYLMEEKDVANQFCMDVLLQADPLRAKEICFQWMNSADNQSQQIARKGLANMLIGGAIILDEGTDNPLNLFFGNDETHLKAAMQAYYILRDLQPVDDEVLELLELAHERLSGTVVLDEKIDEKNWLPSVKACYPFYLMFKTNLIDTATKSLCAERALEVRNQRVSNTTNWATHFQPAGLVPDVSWAAKTNKL